jgi:hypothetical protein
MQSPPDGRRTRGRRHVHRAVRSAWQRNSSSHNDRPAAGTTSNPSSTVRADWRGISP